MGPGAGGGRAAARGEGLRRVVLAPHGPLPEAARAELARVGDVVEADLDRGGLLGEVGRAAALLVKLRHRIDREVMDAAPGLRFIATPTTGLDHVDADLAAARGIRVVCLRGETAFLESIPATAEHTMALLLSLVRRIPWAHQDVTTGRWRREAFQGTELSGKVLGLVGCGRVGRQVARLAAAFGMDVRAHDTDPGAIPDGVGRAASLEELLGAADVVSIHVPLQASTRGLLGAAALGRLRRGALLVNTARGGVLDEGALLESLRSGAIAGAALDVLDGELDGVSGSPLLAHARDHGNLLLTPHLGGNTRESREATDVFIARRLREAMEAAP